MMEKYNQSYSEIKDIPIDDITFFLELNNAEGWKYEQEMKKMKKLKKPRIRR